MPALRWVRDHAGRRGAFLAFLTVLDACYGYSLMVLPHRVAGLELIIPPHVWAWAWVTSAAVCASGIFARHDRAQYTAAVLLKTGWTAEFARLWWIGVPGVWPSVAIWGCFTLTVMVVSGWPEALRVP